VSDQKGKSISRELKDNDANVLLGLQIGQETDASILGLQGKIKITGGSDKSGVAMRGDVAGVPRKRILISKGVGLQDVKKGLRKRKLVRGNIISEEIYQINCKYDGKIDLEPKEEAPKEEAKKEAPKKEAPKKEAPKKEAPKKEAPKKEAPKKEAPKKEAPKKE
jgi:small subunit ribosomal protein S6e